MVRPAASDPGQLVHHGDTRGPQCVLRADPGALQQRRGADRARGHDGLGGVQGAPADAHPGDPATLDHQGLGRGSAEHGQHVRAAARCACAPPGRLRVPPRRGQVGGGGADPAPLDGVGRDRARAGRAAGVLVRLLGMAQREAGGQERVGRRGAAPARGARDAQRARVAVPVGGAEVEVVLQPPVVRQDVGVGPAGDAPVREVLRDGAHEVTTVDRTGAAQHASPRHGALPPLAQRRPVGPVEDVAGRGRGERRDRDRVRWDDDGTRLDQGRAHPALGEPARKGAPRGSRAHHHHVEPFGHYCQDASRDRRCT